MQKPFTSVSHHYCPLRRKVEEHCREGKEEEKNIEKNSFQKLISKTYFMCFRKFFLEHILCKNVPKCYFWKELYVFKKSYFEKHILKYISNVLKFLFWKSHPIISVPENFVLKNLFWKLSKICNRKITFAGGKISI